jgi:DNA-binding CsgD family transcriptional regulator
VKDPEGNPLTYDASLDEGQPGDIGGQHLSPNGIHSEQAQRTNGDRGDRRDTRRTSWTAAELLATTFPDPKWAVPDIIPEGLTVLAGPPKAGKSWLAFGLGIAVASGGKALGSVDVDQGEALYLALEDTPRRLKARLGKILGPDPAPSALTIAVECPPLPMGGDERIAGWLDQNPAARLVVIDVFARVRGPMVRDVSAYDNDYAATARAKTLADAYGIAVVLVHHTRKATDDDFVATISGTFGMTGAADAIAVLKRTRGRADGILSLTGRDVDEAEHALTFAADLGAWQLSSTPAAELRMTDTERSIVAWLAEHDGDSPKRVALGTGLDHELIKKTMRRMAERGDLDTDDKGHYWTPVPAVPDVPHPGQGPLFGGQQGDSLSPDDDIEEF